MTGTLLTRHTISAPLACIVAIIMMVTAPVTSAAEETGTPRELVLAMGQYGLELNPYRSIYAHEMQLFTGLYEGLFSYDPQSLEPVRALAGAYAKSEDGKTWTFTIRSGAMWADGSPITAQDFVESWLYLLDPETAAEYAVFFDIIQGAKAFRTGQVEDPSGVGLSAPDENTLVVRLNAPAAYFTRLLCHSSFVPVHRSLRHVRTWTADTIVGNGPYVIASMDDAELVMKKNPRYRDGEAVAIPVIRIVFTDDEARATQGFNDGGIHWLTDVADVDALLDDSAIQYSPLFATGYYFWNATRKPWSDARVRRALTLMVPWNTIRTEDNFFAPTSVLVLPFAGYESPRGIEKQDRDQALKLLAAAGYPQGRKLPPVRIVTYDSDIHIRSVEAMREAWTELGVTVEHIVVPADRTIRDARQDGFSLSFTSWIGDFADPAAFLLMWTGDSGLNEAGYRSRDYDGLIARSMDEDGRERLKTLALAERKLLADAPLIPLYHSVSFNVIDTGYITGWYQNPLDIHPFKDLGFGIPKARPFVARGAGR